MNTILLNLVIFLIVTAAVSQHLFGAKSSKMDKNWGKSSYYSMEVSTTEKPNSVKLLYGLFKKYIVHFKINF